MSGGDYLCRPGAMDEPKKERVSGTPEFDGSPAAWLHVMDNTEGIEGNEPMRVLSFSGKNPFGVAGVDYSETFIVTSTPLYRQEND